MFSPVHPHKYSYCKAVCGYSCLFTTVSIFLSLTPHCSLHPQPPPPPHPHLCCNGYHSLTLAQRVIAYHASCLCWPAKMHNSTHWSRDMRDDTQVEYSQWSLASNAVKSLGLLARISRSRLRYQQSIPTFGIRAQAALFCVGGRNVDGYGCNWRVQCRPAPCTV